MRLHIFLRELEIRGVREGCGVGEGCEVGEGCGVAGGREVRTLVYKKCYFSFLHQSLREFLTYSLLARR